mmetsp:Transcript_11815/g.21369  ORF Transcript_11815/g.21369 Transcript_11815/m.21369 type:complete len:203 (-) Transcript_11815:11-619(-)
MEPSREDGSRYQRGGSGVVQRKQYFTRGYRASHVGGRGAVVLPGESRVIQRTQYFIRGNDYPRRSTRGRGRNRANERRPYRSDGIHGKIQNTRQKETGRSDWTLVVRNIPRNKLDIIVIGEWFKQFGTIINIQLLPGENPDHAQVEFSAREMAQAAMDSVDAVMGNRHVTLDWIEHDLESTNGNGEIFKNLNGEQRKTYEYG